MFPDISEFQGAVDWSALSTAYRSGVIEAVSMRASFGTVRADLEFASNQRQCRAAGIPAVYYHFCYPAFNSPQAEASFFNFTVGKLEPREAMMADFEDDPASGSVFPRGQAGADWAKAFLSALQSPQNATWWYTYPSFFGVVSVSELSGTWPLVLADYSNRPDSDFPDPIARQFTNCGSTPGVGGCCDQNRVLKTPLSQWLTPGGADLTPEQAAQLAYLYEQWNPGPAGGPKTLRDYFGDIYNNVNTLLAELPAGGSGLTAAQAQELADALAAIKVLSGHLGVGTP